MKPILFSTPMVQAVIAGRKTQTRRIIKPQPIRSTTKSLDYGKLMEYTMHGNCWDVYAAHATKYKPGDILWVRETWVQIGDIKGFRNYAYKTDHDAPLFENWRPSIHMPRAAARIFLRVTDVRVERVQDISEEDAQAEGFEMIETPGYYGALPIFSEEWNELYDAKGYGWSANPWVWVYTFERTEASPNE